MLGTFCAGRICKCGWHVNWKIHRLLSDWGPRRGGVVCSLRSFRCRVSGREQHRVLKSESGHEFGGVMRYLTNKSGGNIHGNGTIKIAPNEYYCPPKNLVDYESDSIYRSCNDRCSAICFGFKDRRVQLMSKPGMADACATGSWRCRTMENRRRKLIATTTTKRWMAQTSRTTSNWQMKETVSIVSLNSEQLDPAGVAILLAMVIMHTSISLSSLVNLMSMHKKIFFSCVFAVCKQ